MLHASFPRSVTLTQLRFALLTVTSSQRDSHPQVCAHAGRTQKKSQPDKGWDFEYWWSRRESNPRPQVLYDQFYMLSRSTWVSVQA